MHETATARLLDIVETELAAALAELRALAAGILPPVLADHGLDAAIEELAFRSPIPVAIEQTPDRRLPRQVERAAYFVIAEALANVAKHSGAGARLGARHPHRAHSRRSRSATTAPATPTPRAGPGSAGSPTASARSAGGCSARARPDKGPD